ncbi:MAG: sigma-70 family RNA polymerase sigma factor [Minisyncoccia bacterium]
MENEADIVAQAQTGDSEAFGLLYDHYLDPIYRFIYYKVFSRELAEDLTSDVFLKALRRLSSYNSERGRFNSWLYQIARNSVVDYYRTKKESIPIDDVFDLGHDERTPEQLDALAGLAKVEEYLRTLPARQREIITLRIWEGKSFDEIAELLGGTEGSAKMAFSRSIRLLREVCGESALSLLLLGAVLPFPSYSYYIHI